MATGGLLVEAWCILLSEAAAPARPALLVQGLLVVGDVGLLIFNYLLLNLLDFLFDPLDVVAGEPINFKPR